jgi:hypothetical protein
MSMMNTATLDNATVGSWYAAVGDDGWRPVVWGLGPTEQDALSEAESELIGAECRCTKLTVHPITAKQVERVLAGDISWPVKVERNTKFWCAACGHSFHSDAMTFEPEGCPECASLLIKPDSSGQPSEPSYDDSREVTGRGEY